MTWERVIGALFVTVGASQWLTNNYVRAVQEDVYFVRQDLKRLEARVALMK